MATPSVLEIIYNVHFAVSEKFELFKKLTRTFSSVESWNEIESILQFLNENIPVHFDREALVINALTSIGDKTGTVARVTGEILKEHAAILEHFARVNAAAVAVRSGNGNKKDEFLMLANTLIVALKDHAGKEDAIFFPLAQKMLTNAHLQAIQDEIAKDIRA